jgi:ferredoxin-type protein NapH
VKRFKISKLRWLTISVVFVVVVLGLVFRTATGTLCAFGRDSITAVCPLGSLETMVAGRTVLPVPLISLAAVAVIALLLGRVFCGWICPMPVMRRWFRRAPAGAPELLGDAELRRFRPQAAGRPSRVRIDSRHWVLVGALLSTAVFGFPVFCLVCPIGLTFGTIAVLWRLLHFNEPSWSLLVFPAMLAVELVVFKTWCRRVCPLGALLSLLSSANVFARPAVDPVACLRTSKGMQCGACETACYEGIDLHDADKSPSLSECTKCFDCVDACPVHAISLPFLPRKQAAKVQAQGAEVQAQGEEEPCRDSASAAS